ncbi:hypothetical protein SAMN05444360_12616 [Chryseobacterium carnipullorum]|nr:hypothetical protein SAMN05444360_12616 [Chryseobacterium carnipullorum]
MKYTVKPHKDKISSAYGALIIIAVILVGLFVDSINF